MEKKADQVCVLMKPVAAAALIVHGIDSVGFPGKPVAWFLIAVIRPYLLRRFAKEILQFPVRFHLQHPADVGEAFFLPQGELPDMFFCKAARRIVETVMFAFEARHRNLSFSFFLHYSISFAAHPPGNFLRFRQIFPLSSEKCHDKMGCTLERGKIHMQIGFDNDKYTAMQSERIRQRIDTFGGKLYMEFGGKLFDDYHASRVLPGFLPDSKVRMLLNLKDQAELVIVINADDIEKSKVRGDLGITYDADVLRLIDAFRGIGLYVSSVVMTRWNDQHNAVLFKQRLENLGVRVFRHFTIEGYPYDVEQIVSDNGFGRNEYVETTCPLVVVTAPGPGSGKMAVCLSQLYKEHQRGVQAGYAKFETFPIWNLPLNHPVNVAYEAATADLDDVNMIDPFHLEAYGETTVNYNRDVEIFPVLKAVFERIYGTSPYKSPTDMGVNMAGNCIIDDEVCREAAHQEIIRRYFAARCLLVEGHTEQSEVDKLKMIYQKAGLNPEMRPVIAAARQRAEETSAPALALELPDGTIVTGKTSSLLGPSAAVLLNALKKLAGINKKIRLISPTVISPLRSLKCDYLGNHNPRLHSDEVLVALSICAATNETAALAMQQLPLLAGCEAHSTVILPQVDSNIFRRLKVNVTCDAKYQSHKLYHKK